MTNALPEGLTYRFCTLNAPPEDRFEAWREDASPLFEFSGPNDARVPYDSQIDITRLDHMMFGGRSWLQPAQPVVHRMSRSSRRIRSDGLDAYYLQLQIGETLRGYAGDTPVHAGPGDLCLLDLASPFDLEVTTGDTICMVIPREMLPESVARLHGRSLTGCMRNLLADYLRSLRANLPLLTANELPYAIQATHNILQACLVPSSDAARQAQTELDALVVNRIRAYIDEHWMSPDLCPEQICKAMGISRSKLFRLFEPYGGVMKVIQHKRLLRARQALSNPLAPRQRISELAWRHGFVNEKHFSRLFKEKFGYSPSEAAERRHQPAGSVSAPASGPPEASRQTFSEWVRAFVAG